MNIFKSVVKFFRKLFVFLKKKFLVLIAWLLRSGPGVRARKGSVIGVFSVMLLLMAYNFSDLRTGYGLIVDIIVGVLIGAIGGILIYLGVRLALKIITKIPLVFGSFFIAGFISLMLAIGLSPNRVLVIIVWIFLFAAFIGGAISVLSDKKYRSGGRKKIIAASVFLFLGIFALLSFFYWMSGSGTDIDLVKVNICEKTQAQRIETTDPSLAGDYNVQFISYGSGEDRRDIFGKDVDIITERIDGKAFVNKLKGFWGKLRKKYWGFNRTKFPMNGRVWYPEEDGVFPLVLIVHGNHSMREYSDPGYEYLGKLLASRGYIFVSLDENFLNGDWSKNYKKENDARAWVMLEHLKLWRDWSMNKENVFYNKIDMQNISLIGHSRGGEAVSVAAAFNKLKKYPDNAKVEFDYDFNIKSIIPIAPIDGQYMPSDMSTPLENIDYLLFQGSHDSDVSSFSGDKQYKRIKFTDSIYHVKTSIYIYRANHGQFNTVWGNRDWGLPGGYMINTKALLDGEDQRQIAKVYISAFLDMTLKGNKTYLPMFRDYRAAGDWLPETLYINRFEDSETLYICDYDEDIDVTTTTINNGNLFGENLATWREEDIGFRNGRSLRQNQAVYLGWEYSGKDSILTDSIKNASPAKYTIQLPEKINDKIDLNFSGIFTFAVAQLDEKPNKPDSLDTSEYEENWSLKAFRNRNNKNKSNNNNEESDNNNNDNEEIEKDEESAKKNDKDENKPKDPVNFTIVLTDKEGESSSIQICDVKSIMPPLKVQFMRYKPFNKNYGKSSEPTLQTIEIPLKYFVDKNELFDHNKISNIQFLFNKTNKAVIILDEIGFRRSADK